MRIFKHMWAGDILHSCTVHTCLQAFVAVAPTHSCWHNIVLSLQKDCFIPMCHPSCRTHIHLHPLACSWAFHHGLSSLSSTSTSQVTLPINKHCVDPQNKECGTVAKTTSSTGYEPNVIDNSDYSETTELFIQESSSDSRPSDLHACGQCLIYRESRRKFFRLRLDALSIPNYVIKKGLTHGARHGKTEV